MLHGEMKNIMFKYPFSYNALDKKVDQKWARKLKQIPQQFFGQKTLNI